VQRSSRLASNPAADHQARDPDVGVRLIGANVRLARDQEVFGEGEPADQVYKVLQGGVRALRLLSDGRRQICDFYLPGDVFGLESGGVRWMTAEALVDTKLIVARRSGLGDDHDAAAARQLWVLAMTELRRGRDHAVTLGRRSAAERVANFLVALAERLGGGESVELPMSRQDIADHLGLTIETVSRTLTQMQTQGVIELAGCRCVHLRKPRVLAQLVG
jgi:CRP-like cAMP-binding protein